MRRAAVQRHGNSRWRNALFVLATVLAVAGCTARFAYNHLDSVALWYISSVVSLDDEQESAFQHSLRRMLTWHRRNELGRYAKFLRDFADRAATPIDTAVLEQAGEQIGEFWHAMLAQVAPDGVRLLTSLRPEQVDEFVTNLENKDRERRDKALARSPQEQIDLREQALIKQLTRWLGSLDDEQRAIAKEAAARMPLESDAGYESRQEWRTRLRDTLIEPAPSIEARDRELLALLEHPESTWTEAHKAHNEEEKRSFTEMLLQLDRTLKPAQRQAANRKLLDFARQLEALQ